MRPTRRKTDLRIHTSYLFYTINFVLLLPLCVSQPINEPRWNWFVRKLEGLTVDLARQVEQLYANRCNSLWLADCTRSNYYECSSSYDSAVCLDDENFLIDKCLNVTAGAAKFDYSCSTVRIPALEADGDNGNPTDPQVIETICFTKDLDAWFKNTSETAEEFWKEFGVQPSLMYFGSHTGAFRIFPAMRSYQCGAYDPRTRPWYVAASSGPKNVIMLLDVSGSMQGVQLELMKDAAKRVVETLSVGDRIAIFAFNDEVTDRMVDPNGDMMYIASDNAKKKLSAEIDELQATGSTNFLEPFNAAFTVLDKSIDEEIVVECYTAILFLTDGKMTDPPNMSEDFVIDRVSNKIEQAASRMGKPVMLFTHSISEDNPDVDRFPSDLACSTEYGVWSKIDSDDQIVDSFSSYYRLLALGLGSDRNEDFVAWVEPYRFVTGGILGTTVSVPVYDRTRDPHLFLGVVGVDIALAALENAMGVDGTEHATKMAIDKVASRSKARCPLLNLTLCELESYRRQGVAGDLAMCTENCSASDLVTVEEVPCPADHPRDLWINTDDARTPYEISTCCEINEEQIVPPSSTTKYRQSVAVLATLHVLVVSALYV